LGFGLERVLVAAAISELPASTADAGLLPVASAGEGFRKAL
jgi:hypothetical protein